MTSQNPNNITNQIQKLEVLKSHYVSLQIRFSKLSESKVFLTLLRAKMPEIEIMVWGKQKWKVLDPTSLPPYLLPSFFPLSLFLSLSF